jgi:hypothetical protein
VRAFLYVIGLHAPRQFVHGYAVPPVTSILMPSILTMLVTSILTPSFVSVAPFSHLQLPVLAPLSAWEPAFL